MLTYVSAKIGANSGKNAIFLHHFFGKITNLRKRYDVIGSKHVTFSHHLGFATYCLNNIGAKFDANRAKIASAMSNSDYAWKKPMMP